MTQCARRHMFYSKRLVTFRAFHYVSINAVPIESVFSDCLIIASRKTWCDLLFYLVRGFLSLTNTRLLRYHHGFCQCHFPLSNQPEGLIDGDMSEVSTSTSTRLGARKALPLSPAAGKISSTRKGSRPGALTII
jgi:hypothetical protein